MQYAYITVSLYTRISVLFFSHFPNHLYKSLRLIAGVRSIADLALLLNMPERMVRQYYRAMTRKLQRSYVAGPGRNMFEENFEAWSVSKDIVAFCFEVSILIKKIHFYHYGSTVISWFW